MGDFHTGSFYTRSLHMHVRKAEFVVSVWDGLRGNNGIARISGSHGMTPTFSSRAQVHSPAAGFRFLICVCFTHARGHY